MHIAGVLVHAHPEKISRVQMQLGDLTGLEVHAANPDGRLVITIESESRQAVAQMLTALHNLPGVLSACLVYEESDSEIEYHGDNA
jgi:nitrate reductase NapD